MSPTIQLQLLLITFASWVGHQQTSVIQYLVEENRVLKEQIETSGHRMCLTDDQPRRLAAKGKPVVSEDSIDLKQHDLRGFARLVG